MAPRRSWLVLLLDALLASCGRLVTVVTPCVSKGSSSRHLMAPGMVVFLTGTVPTLLFVEGFLILRAAVVDCATMDSCRNQRPVDESFSRFGTHADHRDGR